MLFALSQEQELLIQKALEGKNILVDACIGSGKTTTIQQLCQRLPASKSILYLTYNRLLKVDAKSKINGKNITVTNYHGFAYNSLKKAGISCGITDLIQTFIAEKTTFPIFDVLVIDEYQDIDLELSELLEKIKASNPNMQIIAVGDMEQKIYDRTTLDVKEFISQFLGEHERLAFTKCFRLNASHAAMLGRIWGKEIIGVNETCQVSIMTPSQVIPFLSSQSPEDVLCLGSRKGMLSLILNKLETGYPDIFNKKTVYASISDTDRTQTIEPDSNSAIFTTYDSSKGLERKICVVFDFVESYWSKRAQNPQQSYEILRNIFCVAASRGKDRVVFVIGDQPMLSEATLSTPTEKIMKPRMVGFSEMFDFKYKESVEKCYSLLDIKEVPLDDRRVIDVKTHDYLIDLAPCIGTYQEASFFEKYDIDKAIELYFKLHAGNNSYPEEVKQSSLVQKILFLTALETRQQRYTKQVSLPFISKEEEEILHNRLSIFLSRSDNAQVPCIKLFDDIPGLAFIARGFADAVKNNVVYELKFVSELKHEHYLQCACYMIALNLKKGILWNTRKNVMFEIRIPNEKQFCLEVSKTVLKITDKKGEFANNISLANEHPTLENGTPEEKSLSSRSNCFAVIDTETTWSNLVMSIGLCVVEKESYRHLEEKYYILIPEANEPGMYSDALRIKNCPEPCKCTRSEALEKIRNIIEAYSISEVFAYNAPFDYAHLPEMDYVAWYDIMKIAAYKQFNSRLPDHWEYCKTGRLKHNYGAEPMLRLLSGNNSYCETHNAALDAFDETELMKMMNVPYEVYLKNAYVKPIQTYAARLTNHPTVARAALHNTTKDTYNAVIQEKPPVAGKLKGTYDSNSFIEPQRCSDYPTLISADAEALLGASTGTADKAGDQDTAPDHCKAQDDSAPQNNADTQNCYEYRTISTADAAALLGVSKSTLYRHIKNGSISAIKKDNRYYISEESVFSFIEKRNRQQRASIITSFVILGIMLILSILFFIVVSR